MTALHNAAQSHQHPLPGSHGNPSRDGAESASLSHESASDSPQHAGVSEVTQHEVAPAGSPDSHCDRAHEPSGPSNIASAAMQASSFIRPIIGVVGLYVRPKLAMEPEISGRGGTDRIAYGFGAGAGGGTC